MSEMVGYEGKIFMTHPTKAICPIMLVCCLFVAINFTLVNVKNYCRAFCPKSCYSYFITWPVKFLHQQSLKILWMTYGEQTKQKIHGNPETIL